MCDGFFEQLKHIASEMDETRPAAAAIVGYDVLSDAIVWSDEYPETFRTRMPDFGCVRLLLRYRTTRILGEPDQGLRPYWEKAKSLFPNWAGFHADRAEPTAELREFYQVRSQKNMQFLQRFMTGNG